MERQAMLLSGSKSVGGLSGILPTADIAKARRAYMDYIENFSGPDSEKLDFIGFAQKWKKNNG